MGPELSDEELMKKRTLTVAQAMKVMQYTRATIMKLCKDGELTYFKEGNRYVIGTKSIQDYYAARGV